MTVKELKEELEFYDDDMEVQFDFEGDIEVESWTENRYGDVERMAIEALRQKPSISEDGTLAVNVEDGSKVSRVLVCGDNHFGGLYYPEQEPKSEWQQDHEILKAYSDGANAVLDKIRDEIEQLPTAICTETFRKNLPAKDFKEDVFKIIDKYKAEGSVEE